MAPVNAGTDTVNSVKQAHEFGLTRRMKLVGLLCLLGDVRAMGAEAVLLGCTEIPLLVAQDDGHDLINPVALLAEAAVRLSAGLAPELPAVIR